MRWLLTFVFGVIVGAAALFVYLRQVPHEAAPQPVASGAVPTAPVAATAPAPAPDPLAGKLPPPPAVAPTLNEADLPLDTGAGALAQVPALPSSTAAPGKLLVPVDGIKVSQLSDTFDQARGKERHHEALDIMAPKGSRVRAAADGKVVKLFTSKLGGLTVYQFDPSEKYAYYYAHLDHYADGLKEGTQLHRGDLVGYVGSSGDASPQAPHLHFAVMELTPAKQWWNGKAINPFPLLVD
jgi:murein DD-endopeptidase MepM/ murein hydrolase activator NlpD